MPRPADGRLRRPPVPRGGAWRDGALGQTHRPSPPRSPAPRQSLAWRRDGRSMGQAEGAGIRFWLARAAQLRAAPSSPAKRGRTAVAPADRCRNPNGYTSLSSTTPSPERMAALKVSATSFSRQSGGRWRRRRRKGAAIHTGDCGRPLHQPKAGPPPPLRGRGQRRRRDWSFYQRLTTIRLISYTAQPSTHCIPQDT